jgi:hypothetical protein
VGIHVIAMDRRAVENHANELVASFLAQTIHQIVEKTLMLV